LKKFAVIGLGRWGRHLAASLLTHGHKVVAVDSRQEAVDAVRETALRAVRLDATDAHSLKIQDINKVDAAIVTLGHDFSATVLITTTLKDLGVPYVVSRAADALQSRVLRQVGADQVVNPEQESAVRLSSSLSNPNLFDFIDLSEGHSLIQVKAPEAFHNKTLGQIDLRKKFKVNLVAIKKQVSTVRAEGQATTEQRVIDVPMADTVIRPNDILVLVGATESLAKLPT
jgi:trk system potassium uptake protein TrkA